MKAEERQFLPILSLPDCQKTDWKVWETLYVSYTPADELFTKQLAKRYGLKQSGGSDFHGSNKPHIDLGCGKGNLKIPYEILEQLRA